MTRGWALFNAISVLVLGLMTGCVHGEAQSALKLANEASLVVQCDDFQASARALHARLTDLTDDQIDQFDIVRKRGLLVCKTSLVELTERLRAIERTLP